MTKVFVGGSRRASRLSTRFRKRLEKILEKGFPIVVGDANGADKAVQQYLHSRQYRNVEVFCSNGICRNNLGNWPTRSVPAESRDKTAEFYSAKDRAMAQEATVGLMMWDGRSVGTLLNVFRLLTLQKKAVVYTVPEKRFLEFRSHVDWEAFLGSRDLDLRHKVEERAKREGAHKNQPIQRSLPV